MWSEPTSDDVLKEFTPQEKTIIDRLKGGSDDLGGIMERVVTEIRSYIAAGGYAVDSDPATLPPSLFNDAIALARWRFLISVPDFKQFQTEARKDAKDDALDKLKLVASTKFAIDPPDGGVPDRGGDVDIVGENPRLTSRCALARI